jgi:cytochrome c biogenesis protein CcmG/thiol:disulfide interchange protein DsbE
LRTKRRVVALVAATVIGGAGLLSLLLTRDHKGERRALVGAPAPAIDLPDVRADRARVVLAELRGTPVLVNFWATWCTPCRKEMPLLDAADQRLGGRVAILGVDVRDNRAEAVRFLTERGIDYPSAYDPGASLRRSFEFVGLPVTVLVGRDGRVVDRVTGAVTRSRLDGLLDRGQATE